MSSKYYVTGNKKWDAGIDPATRSKSITGTNTNPGAGWDGITALENLVCVDVVLSLASMSIEVTKGDKTIHISIREITSMDTQGNMMVINTIDNVPYTLVFKNEAYQTSAATRIYELMNGNDDPGC